MKHEFAYEEAQRHLKQRNRFAALSAVLGLTSLLAVGAAATREESVILVPVTTERLTLGSGGTDAHYLELVTRDTALMLLNRAPESLDYWMEQVLKVADPSAHGSLKAELVKIVDEQRGKPRAQLRIQLEPPRPQSRPHRLPPAPNRKRGGEPMTLLSRPFPAALTSVALAIATAAYASPAHADQFVEAADGAAIDCVLARGALTRIALIEDGFANVSKMASGFPYNDFEVTHEPVRGDIYVSVPLQYASAKVSFFATSSAGYVYKFTCRVEGEEASQLFVTNPALAKSQASEWEGAAVTRDEAAIRLIEAMASDGVLPGFRARAELSRPRHTDSLEVQQVAEYEGAELIGQAFTLRNLGPALVDLAGEREAPAGALAFAYGRNSLEPGESTQAFLVFTKGGLK